MIWNPNELDDDHIKQWNNLSTLLVWDYSKFTNKNTIYFKGLKWTTYMYPYSKNMFVHIKILFFTL
jgi:hypothetical protein